MSQSTVWRVLVVDDDPDIIQQASEFLQRRSLNSGERVAVTGLQQFDAALDALEVTRYDIIVLDVRLGGASQQPEEEAGVGVLKQIRARRFLPVIFYTAYAEKVEEFVSPLVVVVSKSYGMPGLMQALEQTIETGVPQINRALLGRLEAIQREYMWETVEHHWDGASSLRNRVELFQLLGRRVSRALSGVRLAQLVQELGGTVEDHPPNLANPMQYYLYPPLEDFGAMPGDLYHGRIGKREGWWILLTPSCDLANNKAPFVVLAQCSPIEELEDFRLKSSNRKKLDGWVSSLVRNGIDRYHFLPAVPPFSLPNLVIDFQMVVSISCSNLEQQECVESLENSEYSEEPACLLRKASLDSPFAEELINRFSRYFGRIGTPDLPGDSASMILSGMSILKDGST